MPVNSASQYVLGLLDGLTLPGAAGEQGNLAAYVTPPDPGELATATVYIWPATGEETRVSSPRATAPGAVTPGWKKQLHHVELFLAWIGAGDDPAADLSFPAVIDAVMAALRGSPDPAEVTDPVTGAPSSLMIDLGETMTYDYSVLHTLEDQRYLRYDARLLLTLTEYFQALPPPGAPGFLPDTEQAPPVRGVARLHQETGRTLTERFPAAHRSSTFGRYLSAYRSSSRSQSDPLSFCCQAKSISWPPARSLSKVQVPAGSSSQASVPAGSASW